MIDRRGQGTAAAAAAPPTRCQLYVPGHRPALFEKALASGADALVLDLEDAVPHHQKAAARNAVADLLAARRSAPGPLLLVRLNAAETGEQLDDLLAVVEAGADGVVVPKVAGREDVVAVDRILELIERRSGRKPGDTLIVPLLETASAMRDAYNVAKASDRVAYLGGISARGGDIERALGFRWSSAGLETLAMRAQILLDAKAAAVPHPLTGLWTDISDLDGLCAFARQSRDLGYEGMIVIHPSHVPVVNAEFEPTADELARDRKLIELMADAERDGLAAVTFEGHMVDIAMVKTAEQRLARAEGSRSRRD